MDQTETVTWIITFIKVDSLGWVVNLNPPVWPKIDLPGSAVVNSTDSLALLKSPLSAIVTIKNL